MTGAEPQKLSLLAKLIIAAILALIVTGIVWHGVSTPPSGASGTTSSSGRTRR